MMYKVLYAEYMEYEEDVEASSEQEAKVQFERAVQDGQIEPTEARVMEYKVSVT